MMAFDNEALYIFANRVTPQAPPTPPSPPHTHPNFKITRITTTSTTIFITAPCACLLSLTFLLSCPPCPRVQSRLYLHLPCSRRILRTSSPAALCLAPLRARLLAALVVGCTSRARSLAAAGFLQTLTLASFGSGKPTRCLLPRPTGFRRPGAQRGRGRPSWARRGRRAPLQLWRPGPIR